MIKVTINKFSCIDSACFELGKITLLIGPQASGKSILCKMNYFFIDVLDSQSSSISEGLSFDGYLKNIKSKFMDWFPISAWGSSLFTIEFKAGNFEIRLSRTSYRGVPADNFRIWTSENLKEDYSSLIKLKQSISKKLKSDDDIDFRFMLDLRDASEKNLKKTLGADYFERQIFVPAGRSFFTNLGKALSVFEHGKILDPLTLNFGRIYARFRDLDYRYFTRRSSKKNEQLLKSLNTIFGGEIIAKGNEEFVLSNDGRKIPFSALSSGQQELLPLLTVLPYLLSSSGNGDKTLTYIEEPEAHLFPEAQSKLISALSSILNISNDALNMVLTTHSPYVLSKFNNLIKANKVGMSSEDNMNNVIKIIPKSSWLNPDHIKAYAINNGKLVSILDDEGYISSEYLDAVSEDISKEYEELLKIEYPIE